MLNTHTNAKAPDHFALKANQASIGITALSFNWVMITRLGTDGVAALTVINNIWLMGLFASYGMSDGLQPKF